MMRRFPKNSDRIVACIKPLRVLIPSHAPCFPGRTQDEMFVHKSGDYVTGEGVSGTVPSVCLRGSLVAVDTPTHDSDLVLEK